MEFVMNGMLSSRRPEKRKRVMFSLAPEEIPSVFSFSGVMQAIINLDLHVTF